MNEIRQTIGVTTMTFVPNYSYSITSYISHVPSNSSELSNITTISFKKTLDQTMSEHASIKEILTQDGITEDFYSGTELIGELKAANDGSWKFTQKNIDINNDFNFNDIKNGNIGVLGHTLAQNFFGSVIVPFNSSKGTFLPLGISISAPSDWGTYDTKASNYTCLGTEVAKPGTDSGKHSYTPTPNDATSTATFDGSGPHLTLSNNYFQINAK